MSLRRSALVCLALSSLTLGCKQVARSSAQTPSVQAEMKTIDNIDPRPAVIDPPPMLHDEAAPPKPKGQPWEEKQPVVLTAEDEKMRAALPFTPAIAMDPIDGSKISMLAKTPTFEYKGHIYYFQTEENKKTFMANPEQYSKGTFSHL
jgi:YHS domain-containing protein